MQHAVREDPPPAASPDEIRLADYLQKLRDGWLAIVLGVAAGLALGFGVFAITPRTYEATTTLRVTASKVGETPAVREGPADFIAVVANQRVASEVVQALAPWDMTAQALLRRVIVESVPASTLIRVRVRLPDPERAALVANQFADRAIALSSELSSRESVTARDRLRAQLEDARKQLEEASARYEAFRRTSQVEALKSDVEALLKQRSELLTLFVELEGERASLAQAERERAARNRIDVLRRALDVDAEASAAAGRAGIATNGPNGAAMQLRTEVVSDVFEKVDGDVARLRTRVAGLQRQWSELAEVRKLGGARATTLSRYYEADRQRQQLAVERDLAEQVYKDIATTYEKARVRVQTGSATLQLLDSALVPDQHVAPRRSALLAVGALSGLLTGAIIALARRRGRAA